MSKSWILTFLRMVAMEDGVWPYAFLGFSCTFSERRYSTTSTYNNDNGLSFPAVHLLKD